MSENNIIPFPNASSSEDTVCYHQLLYRASDLKKLIGVITEKHRHLAATIKSTDPHNTAIIAELEEAVQEMCELLETLQSLLARTALLIKKHVASS
jgi:hypothetical protein